MTINELIELLNEYKTKYGDIPVFIQNGDEGGEYYGIRGVEKESTTVSSSKKDDVLILDGWKEFR